MSVRLQNRVGGTALTTARTALLLLLLLLVNFVALSSARRAAVEQQLPPPPRCCYNKTLYKSIVFNDTSNDDAVHLSPEQLINRSGFTWEEYYAVADDGYITQILRLVNPRAARGRLKYPPILMMHGSHMDLSTYTRASSIQHTPEHWPRRPSDGPTRSWNRSLAFTLANNGYDVWLVATRGSNKRSWYFTNTPKEHQARQPHFRPDPSMLAYSYTPLYWQHGLDSIIDHEIGNQIHLVLNVTGAREFHLYTYSLSTMTTLAYLAARPEVARKVRVYAQMAPVVGASHVGTTHWAYRLYWQKFVPNTPALGIGFAPTYFLDNVLIKGAIMSLARSPKLRYSLVQRASSDMFGPSPRYATWLELNMVNAVFSPVSYKSIQSYALSSLDGKFRKFDYGRVRNLLRYGRARPPEYKIDKLEVQNYLILSGLLDALGDPLAVQRLKAQVATRRPVDHIVCEGCNHIDLIAHVEVANCVNLPALRYLDSHSDWERPAS